MTLIYDNQTTMFGTPKPLGFEGKRFTVRDMDINECKEFIIKNHYSKKVYQASTDHFGIYIENNLVGALQYGFAMNPASFNKIAKNTKQNEYKELNRMFLQDDVGENAESECISSSIKLLRAKYPKLRWIQSFADERCKLNGCVYQAANFTYYGEHKSRFWFYDNEWFHDSILTDGRQSQTPKGRKLRSNFDKLQPHIFRQFRYIYWMKPRFKRDCLLKEMPFPKLNAARPDDERRTTPRETGGTPVGRSNYMPKAIISQQEALL